MIKSMGRMLSPLNWVRFPKQRLLQDVRFVRNLDPRVASWTPELAIFQTFFRGFLYNLFLGMGILGGYFTEARWENLWNFRSILGGFKCFFIFNPTLGKWSNLTDIFSSNGFVQPTTRFQLRSWGWSSKRTPLVIDPLEMGPPDKTTIGIRTSRRANGDTNTAWMEWKNLWVVSCWLVVCGVIFLL